MAAQTRLQLCALTEPADLKVQHVAGLLAWTPHVERAGTQMVIRFDHGPTALWLAQALAGPDVELVDVDGDGGSLRVQNPQIVLGRYGYRGGRWMFGQGITVALGIVRGAVHAAGKFDRHGLRVECPSVAMMLMLTALLARLGVKAKPASETPCALVSAGHVPVALQQLGIADMSAPYRLLLRSSKDLQP